MTVIRRGCFVVVQLNKFCKNVAECNDSPLDEVEGGTWACNPDPIVYGSMCVLDCTDPLSIPEGDYEVTCTPEGWFPNPSQVSTYF